MGNGTTVSNTSVQKPATKSMLATAKKALKVNDDAAAKNREMLMKIEAPTFAAARAGIAAYKKGSGFSTIFESGAKAYGGAISKDLNIAGEIIKNYPLLKAWQAIK